MKESEIERSTVRKALRLEKPGLIHGKLTHLQILTSGRERSALFFLCVCMDVFHVKYLTHEFGFPLPTILAIMPLEFL